ncbi:MAG: hypothetical protein K2I99_07590 [Bacteroidaceae bacterium]|nr:hypothetical protein [Bacteroidaceae bacterium]
MKKVLTALLFLWTVIGFANAQVCKISNSGDNVEVFSAVIEGNTVKVTVSNDSENISANVTVTVKVTYSNGMRTERTMTFSGKELCKPNKPTLITIPISEQQNGLKATKVEVVSITGTKCQ